MKDFFYSLMTDRRKGPIFGLIKFILYLISLAYASAIIARALLYRLGAFKSHKAPIKIVSVGNLTLGGTGKTPFVIFLVNLLESELKKKTAVLIRGYGWDEQAMLKKDLPETPIIMGEDRVRSSHKAIKLYGSDTAILDDGFQYWELLRDLDIVLVDSRNPFGNSFLFPRGILRESKSALERADIIVFTKVDKKQCDIPALTDEVRKINPHASFVESSHKSSYITEFKSGKPMALSDILGKRVALISSIGDGEYFALTVKDLGADMVDHIIYPDHHDYDQSDVKYIMDRLANLDFDYIITTEKDAVKLERMRFSFGKFRLAILGVQIEIVRGKEILIDRLNSVYIS